MSEPPLLDYATPTARPKRSTIWLNRVVMASAACPVIDIVCIHTGYVVERIQFGHWPIPPDDGRADSWANPLWCVGALAIFASVAALPIHLLLIAAITFREVLDHRWRSLVLPIASLSVWPAAFLLAHWDPLGAYWYFFD